MASVAELEAGMIFKRTKDALAEAKRRGTKLGGYRGVDPSKKARSRPRSRSSRAQRRGLPISLLSSRSYRRAGKRV